MINIDETPWYQKKGHLRQAAVYTLNHTIEPVIYSSLLTDDLCPDCYSGEVQQTAIARAVSLKPLGYNYSQDLKIFTCQECQHLFTVLKFCYGLPATATSQDSGQPN